MPNATAFRWKTLGAALLGLSLVPALLTSGCGTIGAEAAPEFTVTPKSRQVVFSATGSGNTDLYRLNLGTKHVEHITRSQDIELSPNVSPNGKWVAYAGGPPDGEPTHIYVCSISGTGRKQLTNSATASDASPSFSPDGTRVVFARAALNRPRSTGGNVWDKWDIYAVNVDGTNLRRLTRADYDALYPPWFSPDGKTIMFAAERYFSNPQGGFVSTERDVFVVDSDGKRSPQPLTQDGHSIAPAFSPDGEHIVFISDRHKHFDYEVYVMQRDGSRATRVTDVSRHNGSCQYPVFLPDGKRILFLKMIDPKVRRSAYELW